MEQHKPVVLVAEDEPAVRNLLLLALRDEGYRVLAARDGAEALALATRARPECILLDIRMPKVDGVEFAQRYRAAVAEPARIIAMSAHAKEQRVVEQVRPVAFVAKPFDLDALLAVLERHCPASGATPCPASGPH